jgi:hypothetical protein
MAGISTFQGHFLDCSPQPFRTGSAAGCSGVTWAGIMLAGASLFAGGCGSRVGTYPVSGVVTFDGVPIEKGDIIFRHTDGKAGADAGVIAAGRFSFRSKPGTMTVQIAAPRQVPGKTTTGFDGKQIPVYEQYIPARYNEKSTLSAEVQKSVGNEFRFELKASD